MVGIVAIAARRKTSARGLAVVELLLAFAAFVVGMVGLSSLDGGAAYAAAAVGLGAAILAGGHGLHTPQAAASPAAKAKADPNET